LVFSGGVGELCEFDAMTSLGEDCEGVEFDRVQNVLRKDDTIPSLGEEFGDTSGEDAFGDSGLPSLGEVGGKAFGDTLVVLIVDFSGSESLLADETVVFDSDSTSLGEIDLEFEDVDALLVLDFAAVDEGTSGNVFEDNGFASLLGVVGKVFGDVALLLLDFNEDETLAAFDETVTADSLLLGCRGGRDGFLNVELGWGFV